MKKGPLKILMVAPTPFFADRGAHVQIYEQAKALQKLGHSVLITTYHIGRDLPGIRTERTISIPWYKKLEAGPSWQKPFLSDPLLFLKTFSVARKWKPDIIHGHLHEGCAIGFLISKFYGIPLLFDLQGSLVAELKNHKFISENGLLYKLFYWLERLVDNLPDFVVTQSSEMAEGLITKGIESTDHILPIKELTNIKIETSRPINLLDNLRRLRHNINYYGYRPNIEEVKDVIDMAKNIFKPLFNYVLKEIKN